VAEQAAQTDGFLLETANLDEVEDVVGRAVTPHRLQPLRDAAEPTSRFHLRSLGALRFFDVRFGRAAEIDFVHPHIDDSVTILLPRAGTAEARFDRRETAAVAGTKGVILRPGVRKQLAYTAGAETLVVFIDRERLTRHCAQLLGRELGRPLDFAPGLALAEGAVADWLRLVDYLRAEADELDSLLRATPTGAAQAERLMMTALLMSQPHAHRDALQQPQAAVAPFYVKRAEAYIEANADRALTMAELAAESGVSARSLQSGFQSFRGTTPMAHLRSVRLQRARDDLLAADPARDTVTTVAMRWGVMHLGRFAEAYRLRFGESPSDTLRRSSPAPARGR
jgi:AraC-like DNA-binding protein